MAQFAIPDPFALSDPFGLTPRQQQAPLIPSYTPQEEASLLEKIGSVGLGGLEFLGGILNKPGRVVRGLLGGRPRELLNAIPFSDALGITRAEDQVHGTDLLGISKDKAHEAGFFSPEGLGGFATEILTDPLTYLSLGGSAIAKGIGQAALKAGVMPKAISGIGGRLAGFAPGSAEAAATAAKAAELGQGVISGTGRLGGHIGLGFPFMGNNWGTYDLGKLGDAILGPLSAVPRAGVTVPAAIGAGIGALSGGMSDEGNAWTGALGGAAVGALGGLGVRKFGPALGELYTRTIPPIFEGAVKGRTNAAAQRTARAITADEPRVFAETMQQYMPIAQKAQALGFNDEAGSMLLRQAGEVPSLATPLQQEVLNPIQEINRMMPSQLQRAGLPGPELRPAVIPAGQGEGELLGYLHRQTVPQEPKTIFGWLKSKITPNRPEERLEELRGLTSDSLFKMSREDLGATPEAVRQAIGDRFLGLPKWQQQVDDAKSALHNFMARHNGVADSALVKLQEIAESRYTTLANQADELTSMKLAGKLPEFTNHVVKDAFTKTLQDRMNIAKAGRIYEHLAQNIVPAGEDTVPLTKAIRSLWEPQRIAANVEAPASTMAGGAELRMMEELRKAGVPIANVGDLKNLHVDSEFANQLAGLQKLGSVEGLHAFTKVFDSVTNLTKAFQTSWPATVVRNMGQDIGNKFFFDKRDPSYAWFNPLGYFKPISDWKVIANGGTVDGLAAKLQGVQAFKGMNDLEVAAELRKLYTAWDVGRSGVKSSAIAQGFGEVTEQATKDLESLLPITKQPGPIAAARDAGWTDVNAWKQPFGVSGVGGQQADVFPLVRAARQATNASDNLMRGSTWLASLEQGYEPVAAFAESMKAHFDFANLSDIERKFFRRAIPYYCVPETAEILTRDGWKNCDMLIVGEEVMTYNQEKDCLEWQACEDKAIFDHNQSLMVYATKKKSFAFTPEHRWPVRRNEMKVKHSYGEYFYPAELKVIEGKDLNGNLSFIQNAQFLGTDSILTTEQARLLGWAMTDGSFRFRGNHCEMVIYQSPKKFLEEVKQVAGGVPRRPNFTYPSQSPDNDTVCVPVVKEKVAEIRQCLDKDNLIKVVTRLSRPAAEAMYDAMYKADGTVTAGRKGDHFAKQHLGIRAAFRVLALMLGKTTTEGKTGCYISNNRFLKIQSGKITWQHYHGRVWCPKTPNGTWVMKQGTTIIITGNSWLRQNIPSVIKEVVENPGGRLATTVKGAVAARGQEPGFIPPWIGQGVAAPIGPEKEGKQRYLSTLGLGFEDIGQLLGPGGPGGILNPLLKYPIEQYTGKQMFTGRDIRDLHTILPGENVQPLENALLNSPFGRFMTTFRTATDPRKSLADVGLNIGTGARLADVDVDRARRIAVHDYINENIRGPEVRRFETLHVRPDDLSQLSPAEMQLYRLHLTMQRRPRSTVQQ